MSLSLRTPKPTGFRACQRVAPTRGGRVAVRAEPEKEAASSSNQKAFGYTDEDSAGQSNIFAVEPRSYVAGGSADASDNSATLAIGAVAGLIAVGVAFAGLAGNKATVPAVETVYEDAGKYETLSTYVKALK